MRVKVRILQAGFVMVLCSTSPSPRRPHRVPKMRLWAGCAVWSGNHMTSLSDALSSANPLSPALVRVAGQSGFQYAVPGGDGDARLDLRVVAGVLGAVA
jgi:hypothetical protein